MNFADFHRTRVHPLLAGGMILAWLFSLIAIQPARSSAVVLYAAPIAQGSGDCSSWANVCSLQTALAQAQSGDQVWVKEGVHTPTVDPANRGATFALQNNLTVLGGFAGDETSADQRNWEANLTILSGDIEHNDLNGDGNFIAETPADIQGGNSHHVVWNNGVDASAVLDGFIITAGQYEPGVSEIGAGIYNYSASPTLNNLVIIGNSATEGGGMHNNQGSSPTLTNVSFIHNSAVNNGGGLKNYWESNPNLVNVAFIGNSAGGAGGGIDNYVNGMSLTNGLFWDNRASGAAGVYANNATVTLVNVTFSGNIVTGDFAAIYAFYSVYNIRNSILWGDQAANSRETGIYIDRYGDFQGAINAQFSLIQGCGASGSWAGGHCGGDSGGNIQTAPLFLDAVNGNLRLGLTSPAIDSGDNNLLPPQVTVDLDGLPRFVDIPTVADTGSGTPPLVDLGAYEAHPDEVSPSVLSITRLDANPTSAASLRFRVIFSEPVYGVTAADFSLQATGLSGSAVKGVSGGPTIYTVVVATGSGEGTLRLDIPDSATIQDLATNPISGLPFISGEFYTVDTLAPTVISILRAGDDPTSQPSVDFSVIFSEAVSGLTTSDFSVFTTGSLSGAVVTGISGSGESYLVTVSTGTGSGTLRLDIPGSATITDLAGNPLNGLPYQGGEAYHIMGDKVFLPLLLSSLP